MIKKFHQFINESYNSTKGKYTWYLPLIKMRDNYDTYLGTMSESYENAKNYLKKEIIKWDHVDYELNNKPFDEIIEIAIDELDLEPQIAVIKTDINFVKETYLAMIFHGSSLEYCKLFKSEEECYEILINDLISDPYYANMIDITLTPEENFGILYEDYLNNFPDEKTYDIIQITDVEQSTLNDDELALF